jgi:two-component system, LytTR family, sensor kinase
MNLGIAPGVESPIGSRRLALTAAFVFTTVAVLFALQRYVAESAVGGQPMWRNALLQALIVWWTWGLLTPLIAWVVRRLPISQGRLWTIAIHIPAGLAVTALHALGVAVITPQFYYQPAFAPIRDMFRGRLSTALAFDTIVYFLIVAVIYIISYVRESRRREIAATLLESALARSQLIALQAQLQPHFLFNTLNSIVALVHDEPDKAAVMIRRLSELLRYCLAVSERSEVRLSDELQFTRAYLDIQTIRFEERLEFVFDVDAACNDALVPSFLLQPLVENAVKFSLDDDRRTARITVSGSRNDGRLSLSVKDNGPGFSSTNVGDSSGIGIRATRERLERLYGNELLIDISNGANGGAAVSISIPYRSA